MIRGILKITDGSSFPLGNTVSQYAINFAVDPQENPDFVALDGGGGSGKPLASLLTITSKEAEQSASKIFQLEAKRLELEEQKLALEGKHLAKDLHLEGAARELAEKERQLQTLAQRIKSDLINPLKEVGLSLEGLEDTKANPELLNLAIEQVQGLLNVAEELVRLASGGGALSPEKPNGSHGLNEEIEEC